MISSLNNGKEITQPLIGSSKSPLIRTISNFSDSSQGSNKQIDMMRLVSKAERSRVTKVQFNAYKIPRHKEENLIRHSEMVSGKLLEEQWGDDNYSTNGNRGEQQYKIPKFTDNESFLSNYNSNSQIIGIVLFILFFLLIAVEVVTTTYLVPESYQGGELILQETLLTVLASELAYYLLVRYLSHVADKPLFKHKSVAFSFKKLMQKSTYHATQNRQGHWMWQCIFERPYVLLGVVSGLVIISQLVYSILVEQSMRLFDSGSSQNYMISTLFLAYFGLPFIVNNFYFNRPIEEQNMKLKIFPFLVLALMLQSILESWLFFILMACKISYLYIQHKQQFEVFHVEQLIKAALLVFCVFFFEIEFISNQRYDHTHSESFLSFYLRILWHAVLITLSMLLARVLALTYIKQQLYRHFYTEMHINLAILATGVALNVCQLFFYPLHDTNTLPLIFLNLIFIGLIGVIIYQQGREKMLVTLQPEQMQQKV